MNGDRFLENRRTYPRLGIDFRETNYKNTIKKKCIDMYIAKLSKGISTFNKQNRKKSDMSMNIYIKAVAEAKIIKTGELFDHTIYLPVNQTPTEVTYRILNSENKMKEYEAYVLSISTDEKIPIFPSDDSFEEKNSIEYRKFNSGKKHLEELRHDIDFYTKKGYKIIFEMM